MPIGASTTATARGSSFGSGGMAAGVGSGHVPPLPARTVRLSLDTEDVDDLQFDLEGALALTAPRRVARVG